MNVLQSESTHTIAQTTPSSSSKLLIALMGTCGNSLWREPFKQAAQAHEVFDPMVEAWTPDSIFIENTYMMRSNIVVFAITPETDGLISLAEVGLASAGIKQDRQLLVWIAPTCESAPTKELQERSNSVRASVINHLSQIRSPFFIMAFNQAQLLHEFTKLVNPKG